MIVIYWIKAIVAAQKNPVSEGVAGDRYCTDRKSSPDKYVCHQ
jgi:hypothetical protein